MTSNRLGLVLLLLACPVGWIAPATAVNAWTRDDLLGEGWLWGNLTWSGGRGSIEWGPAPETEETGGSATPESPFDEFRSAPLPSTIFLNASRLVQLDFRFQGSGCGSPGATARVSVTLLIGDRFVTGAAGTPIISKSPNPPPPATPAGFKLCQFRMPLERVVLEEGETLTLRVAFEGVNPSRIGVSSEVPTILRLPILSHEEAVYRMPEVVPRVRATTYSPERVSDSLVAGVGVLLSLGPLLAGSRKRAVVLLALAFLSIGWAGCLGDRPAAKEEAHDLGAGSRDRESEANVSYEGDGARSTVESYGTILGRVADRYGYPVEGAFLILLRTPHHTKSDGHGLFSFRDLPAGTYTLRVDRTNYVSLDLEIDVRSKTATRIDVVLGFDPSVALGDRPHFHDYWNGENRSLMLAAPLHQPCGPTPDCNLAGAFYLRPIEGGDRRLIRPGTTEVEVVLTFDAFDSCFTKFGLAIQDNTDSGANNWSFFPSRESGKPFNIKTSWEGADVGHQLFSTWTFGVVQDARSSAPCHSTGTVESLERAVANVQGEPHVLVTEARITIIRGSLPLEPRHPDHWQGREAIQTSKGHGKGDSNHAIANPFPNPFTFFGELEVALCEAGALGVVAGNDYIFLGGIDGVIPQETKHVLVYVNQSRLSDLAGVPYLFQWQLYYKNGARQPEDYVPKHPLYGIAPTPTISPDGRQYVWKIPVDSDDWDGIYNKRSGWRFALVPDDPHKRCLERYAWSKVPLGSMYLTWDSMATRT